MYSSPKNENSVINYSPSCYSKPVLRNTNEDIFDGIWELSGLSDPPIDSKDPYTITVQIRSKEICKIIHVTSGIQPEFYEATRILFVQKKKSLRSVDSLQNGTKVMQRRQIVE